MHSRNATSPLIQIFSKSWKRSQESVFQWLVLEAEPKSIIAKDAIFRYKLSSDPHHVVLMPCNIVFVNTACDQVIEETANRDSSVNC